MIRQDEKRILTFVGKLGILIGSYLSKYPR